MKKILSFVLILAMVLCLFAGCGEEPTTPSTAGATVEDAKTYLYAMYKDDDGTIARRDFKVVGAVMIDGVSFPIEWTTDAPDYVTIGAVENNMVTIDIVEEPAEQVTFKLTATMKDAAGNTASVSITRIIEAAKVTGVEFVAAPVAGTAYKYAVAQNNLGQTIYFTGEMSGYYLATSANPFDAVDVFVEDVEGGVRLYFMKGEVKTYIDVIPRGEDQPGKVNVVLTETPSCVYTWDAERKTYVTNTVADNVWYLGCYNTYNTISASNISYIEDVTKIGDSQFPAGLCNVNIVPTQVATPAVDTAYKFAVAQNNLGQTIYFTGSMSGYYLATSANPAEGVNVYVENAEGGVRLYFMKGEVKTYIDVIPRGEDQPGKVNVVLTETPSCVYTWDAERKTYVTNTVADNVWYLGCYNTYNTISASNISYIEDVTKIGESRFPAGMYIVDGFMEMQPEFEAETPVVEPTQPTTPANPDPAADSTLSIADAIALGASKEHNVYTTGKYYVTGVITEITNETYGNMKIADAEGNVLTVYGTFNADGTLKYGEMETKPAAGDTITVYGVIGQYNGTPQLKNGWIMGETTDEPVEEPTEPAEPGTYTLDATSDLTAMDAGAKADGDMDVVNDYFTIIYKSKTKIDGSEKSFEDGYTATQRLNIGGKTEPEKGMIGSVMFTTTNPGTIKVWWVSGGDGREIALYNANCEVITATPTDSVKNSLYISELEIPEAGTYYLGVPSGSNYIFKIEVTEKEASEVVEPTEPTEPEDSNALATGDKVVIYAPAHNMALSATKTGYYNVGVSVANGFDGITAMEIWIVTINEDGTITLVNEGNGAKLALAEEFSSLNDTGVNDKWEMIAKEGAEGIFYLKNVGRGNYLEWYASKNNWSSYNTSNLDDLFELSFYKVG